ncbi:MAG: lysophospholipid acyltransferase family protein [Brachybacterium sp.]|nr:lysophospholipid acyltransferase family protein [Brachybacterium sp.]
MIFRRRESIYRLIVRAGQTVIALLRMDVRVEGLANLPPAMMPGTRGRRFRPIVPGTGAVVAITHSSFLDFVFAEWAIYPKDRTHMRFMITRKYARGRFMRAINAWCSHIEVDRAKGAAAYQRALELLRTGDWVALFPEGSRNAAVRPHALRTGAVRLAAEAGVPLIPVSVFGGGRLLGGTEGFRWRRLWRAPISVVVGEPVRIGAEEDVREATERLQRMFSAGVDRALEIFPASLPIGAPWVPADLGGSAPTVEQAEEAWQAKQAERDRLG